MGDGDVEARIQTDLVDDDNVLVARIRQHLAEYLADRPDTIRLDTTGLDVETTYARLLDVLAA